MLRKAGYALFCGDEELKIPLIRIRPDGLLIGRDPACQLVLPRETVSARHARLEVRGGRVILTDLNSTNGTYLGEGAGKRVKGSVPLSAHDVFTIDTVPFQVRPFEQNRVPLIAGGAGLVLLVAIAAFAGLKLAGGGGPAAPSSGGAEGRLGRGEGSGSIRSAGKANAQNPGATSGWSGGGAPEGPGREGSESAGLAADPTGVLEGWARWEFIRRRSEEMLIRLGQRGTRIPSSFHRQVEAQTHFYTGRYRDSFQKALDRARPILDDVRAALRRNKLPEELCYLPLIESEYKPAVTSPAGARGLWQLMPGTARDLGLSVSEWRDERTDPVKSTDAAARFMNGLVFEYGADGLMLAIASYNKGPAGVRVALKKMDDPFKQRNFWSLVEKKLLPQETVDYVPRFIAAGIIAEHPEAFGFK